MCIYRGMSLFKDITLKILFMFVMLKWDCLNNPTIDHFQTSIDIHDDQDPETTENSNFVKVGTQLC